MFNQVKIKDVKVEIGQFVKVMRKNRKISQIQLAQTINVSRITIQNLESGKNFTIDTLFKVFQHFDVLKSLYDFFKEKKEETENLKSLY
jgi:transcriptional regulator with XRE-family HTH domain